MFEKKQEEKKVDPETISAELKETRGSCLSEVLLITTLVVFSIVLIRKARVPDKTVVHLVYCAGCWNSTHTVEQMAHFVGDAVK